MDVTPPWALRLRDAAVCLGAVTVAVAVIVRVVTLWTMGYPGAAATVIGLGAVGGCVGAAWAHLTG